MLSVTGTKKVKSASSAIFTIVSANYIGFAATLMQSVRMHHPDSQRFIILSDAYHDFGDIDLAAEIIACDDLGVILLDNMRFWYSVIEFNTAIKPFVFLYMFEKRGFKNAIYIDPDVFVYSPLDEVYRALQDHDIVLTPHMMVPLQDGKEPSDHSIMKAGVYNLGFLGVRNDQDGLFLMKWWSDRLLAHCRVDIALNMFTDQRWMDLAPVFVSKPYILRHPGYNVAYWNLHSRRVIRDSDEDWIVNDKPLKFFHFSGIKPDDDSLFSKHQNRFQYKDLGCVADLCREYRATVLSNKWLKYSKVQYAYGHFPNGRPISDANRRWILRAIDEGKIDPRQPLSVRPDFFDEPDDNVFGDRGRLTRFAYQFWRDRSDLQHAFDLSHAAGFAGYTDWFCNGSAEREGVHALDVKAALRLVQGSSPAPDNSRSKLSIPPWDPIASTAWEGEATAVGGWLRQDVKFHIGSFEALLPKQAALLWERRADLQNHFRMEGGLEDVDAYTAWLLTDGLRSGSISAEFFSDRYLSDLNELSEISLYYQDTPISRGLIITRMVNNARSGFTSWQRFPIEKAARMEHGFWFSYVAPIQFGWPEALYRSVKEFFDRPSALAVEDYRFTIGMLVPWETREDLQRTFRLADTTSKLEYLRWLIFHIPQDYDVELTSLCPDIVRYLYGFSPRHPQLTRLLEFVYLERPDLQAAFDVTRNEGISNLLDWARVHMDEHLLGIGLGKLAGSQVNQMTVFAETIRTTVALTGHWEAFSGLAEDFRSSVAALDSVGYDDYVIVDLDTFNVLSSDKIVFAKDTMFFVDLNIVHRNADTSHEDWQTLSKLNIVSRRVVGHWHWELERLPAQWRHCYSYYDEIWASTTFARDAFNADECRPIRLLNGAVIAPSLPKNVSRTEFRLSATATLFVFMFDFSSFVSRKNPQAVIRAFMSAFQNTNEDVQLFIKTQNAGAMPHLWDELSEISNDKRIVIKDVKLTRDEIVRLIATSNAFVSLHRSEGYGRGPAEAMLLGKPVILTAYSGTNDFADKQCACMVDFKMIPVKFDEYPGVDGQRWADADIDHAAHFMRWIHENPSAAEALGQKGRRKISKMLSPRQVGKKMVQMIGVSCSTD